MPMRVIGGVYRHRKLVYPEDNINIRPTKDRIREAFFSIIGDLANKNFLDLYAGCGSMGIEAISRGADKSYFIDHDKAALKYVYENIASLNLDEYAEVRLEEDLEALMYFANHNIKFNVIYLDPPYEKGKYENILSFIYKNDLVNKNGIVACESNRTILVNNLWNQTIKEYHYGEIILTVLRNI